MTDNVGTADLAQARKMREGMEDTFWFTPEGGKGNTWGKQFVRIFPPHLSMDGSFFWGTPIHFKVGPGQQNLPCPRRAFEQRCPICEKGFELRNKGQEDAFKSLMPSWQGYMNIVTLNEDGTATEDPPRLRVWSTNRKVIDMLMDEMEEHGDFTDLEKGRDVEIRRRGERFKTEYKIRLAAKASKTPFAELVSDLRDLSKVSPYVSQEVLALALEGGTAEGGDPWKPDGALGSGQAKEPDQIQTAADRFGPDDDDKAPAADADQQEAARERLAEATRQPE